MTRKTIMVVTFLFILNCSENKKNIFWEIQVDNEVGSFIDVEIEEVQLENFQSSYTGSIESIDNFLVFIDYRFGWIFFFNDKGEVVNKILGSGNSDNEIPTANISFYSNKPNGGFVFIGNSFDIHDFDENYFRKGSFYIDWNSSKSTDYLSKVEKPNISKSYNLAYNTGKIRMVDEFVYLPLASPPPLYSIFNLTTDFYSKNARIIAKMNLNNGKIISLLGNLSPEYHKNPEKRLFSNFSFDLSNSGDLYLTFQADSLIYRFDKNLNTLHKKFGFSGKGMNLNYTSFPNELTNEKLESYWKKEISKKGYYSYLEYFDESDFLFRGYKKGGGSISDGLQVYHEEKLIADLEVPKDFSVSAYVKPYYYSNIYIDEKRDRVKIYRFKIND